jgi:hypothetical protein
MKRKLFKKFHTIDSNDYYSAVIAGDAYFGVASNYFYRTRLLGLVDVSRVEEQYFHTVKIPDSIMCYVLAFLNTREIGIEIHFPSEREHLAEKMIKELTEHNEMAEQRDMTAEQYLDVRKAYKSMYDTVYAMFYNDWDNSLVEDMCNKGYTMVLSEYAGVATRNVWLANAYDDLVVFVQIKLLGSAKDNLVVDFKRVLMDAEVAQRFVDQIAENTAQGGKHD